MENNFDTICAIITPIANGAVGIVRISGTDSFKIAAEIFTNKIIPRQINYGFIENKGKKFDEVILLPFSAPHSYTGEDVIEIQCHGSYAILNELLNLIISKGARIAQKGEFTKRAFLNNRIDLSQAEAVLDIIQSKSIKSAQNALNNLEGYLKSKIELIKNNLAELYSRIIASVDFPDDVSEVSPEDVVSTCSDNIKFIDEILNNTSAHNYIRDGISACLIGRPNVGKSSLFNAILNYNRAIVTDIAGTTRDTIKETVNIDGYLVNFVDTAGIREKESADLVEQIGIDNSIKAIDESDIVLFLFEKDKSEIDEKLKLHAKNKKILYVKTKSDLKRLEPTDTDNNTTDYISVSALKNDGLDELKNEIVSYIRTLVPNDTNYTTNIRQAGCLVRSKQMLEKVVDAANVGMFCDIYSSDLKSALIALDEITGEVLTDNILDNIFDNFCIGK